MSSLRAIRRRAGFTQVELARRAGVSRQLVGAVEAGRHLPRVDAALALAGALDVDVADLFLASGGSVDVVSGDAPREGALVRLGTVGSLTVTAATRIGVEGWDVADGAIEDGEVVAFSRQSPGVVVAGCEPGLEVLERLLRQRGMSALAVSASSGAAIEALVAGRVHAAVVHGIEPLEYQVPASLAVTRYHLSRWRVGLAGPPEAARQWWTDAMAGRVLVVQRESSAGVQRAFESAVGRSDVDGPRVATHLEAARRGSHGGLPAVTIEPAALAVGAPFHALETHDAELWVAGQWAADQTIVEALTMIDGPSFRKRLQAVGGYDLSDSGKRLE